MFTTILTGLAAGVGLLAVFALLPALVLGRILRWFEAPRARTEQLAPARRAPRPQRFWPAAAPGRAMGGRNVS